MEETQPSDVLGEGNERFSPEHLHGDELGVVGLAWIKLDGKAERMRGDRCDIPGYHSTRSSRNRETTDLSSVKKLPLSIHQRSLYLLERNSSVAPPVLDFSPQGPISCGTGILF